MVRLNCYCYCYSLRINGVVGALANAKTTPIAIRLQQYFVHGRKANARF